MRKMRYARFVRIFLNTYFEQSMLISCGHEVGTWHQFVNLRDRDVTQAGTKVLHLKLGRESERVSK